MRFSVERKPLLAALNAASGVTAGRTTLPILKCVRMSAIGSMVSVTATDLDQIVSSQIASEVGVEGLAIVSLDGFLAWCGTVKGGIVEVSADDATVALRCGTSTVTVLRVPDDEWPEWGGGIIEDRDIDPAPTLDALAALAPAQSNKEARYYLNGIALRDGGLIATNGHTLHAAKLDLGGDVILPRQGVALMMKALAGRPEKARFGHTETMWRLTLPRLTLTGKLVDGTFPDTSRIKVSSDTPEIRFIAEDAEDALKIVTAGARRGTPVRLRAADGK
ncbi:MAG: DNA polymerase III subunit beta [Pseudomonadota bacterium]